MKRRSFRRVAAQVWTKLEARRMFAGHVHDPSMPEILEILPPSTYADATSGSGNDSTLAATSPLSAVPLLASRSSAAAKLYLDFDGDYTSAWGAYSPGATPAYDTDGDKTTFSDAEINAMREIWSRVAEKFSPFNLDVTTVNPGNLDNFKTLTAVIGGAGAWLGASAGGVGYINGFTNSAPNIVFVFEDNLANGVAKYVAEAAAHEAGHGFGLNHQASWSGSTLTAEYNAGNSLVAPVMGNSYSSARGKWWYGPTSSSPTSYQDDMAILANTLNGFGYRADDFGNTIAAATTLTLSGTTVSAQGVIEKTSDSDYFSFETGGGSVSFAATPAQYGAMLDLKLELRNTAGSILASANTASLGESISTNLAAGTYFINVASFGSYGDVGQYTLTGTFPAPVTQDPTPPPVETVNAPSSLLATGLSATQVRLSWTDNSSNETGFTIQRSTDGGTTFNTSWTVGANTVTFTDTTATGGSTFLYRVFATGTNTSSDYSNNATVTTVPAAVTSLAATAVSTSQINLTWSDLTGETSYQVDHSFDGVTWTTLGSVAANTTAVSITGLSAGSKSYFRVFALNGSGASASSNVATATTFATATPAAPTNLTAVAISRTSIRLTWTDNASNESSYYIERSSNGGSTWTRIASVGANTTTYTSSGLKKNSTYVYRVRAHNASGTSAYSNTASAKTFSSQAFTSTPAKASAANGLFSSRRIDEELLAV